MKNIFLISTAALLFTIAHNQSNAQVPNWIWAKSAGSNQNDLATYVATDVSGNIIVSGYFYGSSIIFGTDTLYGSLQPIFVTKSDGNGNILWSKSSEILEVVTATRFGNIIAAGSFTGTIILGNDTLTSNGNNADLVIVKYNTDGNLLWAKSVGGLGGEYPTSITSDNSENILLTGQFSGAPMVFGFDTLPNDFSLNVCILKFDFNGNPFWGNSFKLNQNNGNYNISMDSDGNSFVTGTFWDSSMVFINDTLINSISNTQEIFLIKYDSTGNMMWAKSAKGGYNDFTKSITNDSWGNILITGYFNSDTLIFGIDTVFKFNQANSNSDMFLVKYSNDGNIIWSKSKSGWGDILANSVTADELGNIFVGGTQGSIFITKYNANGNEIWTKSAIGNFYDQVNAIDIDTSNNILIAGFFESSQLIFDADTLANVSDFDNFFQHYKSDMFSAKLNGIVGIGESLINKKNLCVYPNPFYAKTTLQTDIPLMNATLTVDNCFGQTVAQIKNINSQTITLHRDNLPTGLYLLRLIQDNKIIATKKVVIMG